MSNRMITDELFDLVLKRHRKESSIRMNNTQMDSIWFSLYNKVRTEGSTAARQYANTMKIH